jgi:hypothetical protein
MNRIRLHHRILFAAVLFLLGGLLSISSATPAWSDNRPLGSHIAEFNAFMSRHPKASTELQQNPSLVYNRKWLDKHPEVDHFPKGCPELRDAIARRPGRVFGWNRSEERRFDHRDSDHDLYGWGNDRHDRNWAWERR